MNEIAQKTKLSRQNLFYFSDIMGEFSNAKVSFIGSAELYDPYQALYAHEIGFMKTDLPYLKQIGIVQS